MHWQTSRTSARPSHLAEGSIRHRRHRLHDGYVDHLRFEETAPSKLLTEFPTPGFVSQIGRPAEKNGVLVDILLKLGAILYCKTNVPQTLMVRCLSRTLNLLVILHEV